MTGKNKYKDIPFWQNLYRTGKLKAFKSRVEKYFSGVGYNEFDRTIIDDSETSPIREAINNDLTLIEGYMVDANISPIVIYTPPPMLGGPIQRMNVLDNLFNLQNYDIETQGVIDFIDQAVGVYKNDFAYSVLRVFNPLYWLRIILEFVASIPFAILGAIGIDEKKAEQSYVGRIVKIVIKFLALIATAAGIWDFLARLNLVPESINLVNLIK